MPVNLETSPDRVDDSMSNPQLSVPLEDLKAPVPATLEDPRAPIPPTTAAAAAATSEKPSSSAPSDPAKSASIAPPVLAKLAVAETPSTGASPTPSTSTPSTSTGSTSTRTTTLTASSQLAPSDRPTSTDPPATENHPITPSHPTPPTSSSPTSTTPPTSSEQPTSSSEAPAVETSTSTSTAEPSSTTSDPPAPEPTAWESSSSTPEWTSSATETAPTSWSETQSPPAETSSSSWTSDWTESSSSWTAPVSTSSHSLTFVHSSSIPSPTIAPVIPAVKLDPVATDPATTAPTSELTTSPILNATSSPVLKAGVLTTSVQPVSTDGLITSNDATAEASNATDEAQVKKIAGIPVGWFAGLVVAIFVILFAGCFVFARWRKKRSSDETPPDGFDSDHESKRPMTEYDPSFTAARSPDRASSFFNSSSSSKFVTPITPHQGNLAGRGNAWQAPTVPAPSYEHPRASRYMPTSGRAQQPTSAHPSPDQSGMGSNEILADYYPDSDYEQLDEPKALVASKRKTTATTRTGSTGSVYSIDSMWGNASEAPPTARSSFTSSFLPWRRPASEAPAVPAIPEQMQRASPDTGRYAPGHEPTTRLPPRAAMAQTPVAVRQKPGFGDGGFVLSLGGFSR